jgi:glycosyltransferase involved in cell wall biosynthesis
MLSIGVAEERVTLTPYSVDNDWWCSNSDVVNRQAVRDSWGADPNTCVVLFCAKLQPWKRPQDVLHAFARASVPDGLLIFVGEGPQRGELESEAKALGLGGRVRFLGFVNQSELPTLYTAADLMVLPSEYEPFAVVVNEAFCCGCPVVASDRVGAARDLIEPVDPGLIFPCGDISALSTILTELCRDRARLHELGRAVRLRIASWSPGDNIAGTLESIRRAVTRKKTVSGTSSRK